ncbi:MAG: acyloxyacyl hydrolase [Nitrospira sp.]|nr:acyloxyacyl hydrolase [Nitrospira sp.]MBH0197638.1 acyloxyacyl hydrolase [Nitrospira sp.]
MTQVCATVFLCVGLAWSSPVLAEETASTVIGRQTVGVVVGGMLPVRIMEAQSSTLNGVAVHPSWQITVTDPMGDGWWRGSVALGLEAAFLGIAEPTGMYGVGITPKVVYTLASLGRFKPYVEGGGGPLWTNFDGRIPEQGSDFNFLVWGGAGATYDLTARWALNAGVRLSHISNAGIESPNGGVNYLLPFVGLLAKMY